MTRALASGNLTSRSEGRVTRVPDILAVREKLGTRGTHPQPLQGGERRPGGQFPSWEGSGVGWFIGSVHGFLTAHCNHQPPKHRSADLLIGPLPFDAGSGPIRRSALRFMESFHLQLWTHMGTLNQTLPPGSAVVSTASPHPKPETRRQDASAPGRFMGRESCGLLSRAFGPLKTAKDPETFRQRFRFSQASAPFRLSHA